VLRLKSGFDGELGLFKEGKGDADTKCGVGGGVEETIVAAERFAGNADFREDLQQLAVKAVIGALPELAEGIFVGVRG
jgi:hypothetical protein